MSDKDNIRRDLELILLGASFTRGDTRDRILAALPSGTITGEIGDLLDAIRRQDADEIKHWLEHHRCSWEPGQDFIQSVIERVVDEKVRQLTVESLKGLLFLAETAPLSETKVKAAAMLKKLVS